MSDFNFPLVRVKHAHGFTQTGWDLPAEHNGQTGNEGTLVFVHGNPSSKHLWRHLMQVARAQYRCVAIDHIGMGDSDKPKRDEYDFHFEQRVDDLEAFLIARGVNGPVTLIVHDWGGVIGLRFAQRHPQRIQRLVITNTAAFPLLPGKKLPIQIGFIRNSAIGGWLCTHANIFQRGAVWFGVQNKMTRDAIDGYLGKHRNAAECEAILRFIRDIPLKPSERGYDKLVNLRNFLPSLSHVPVQLFWGLKDFVFDQDYLTAFQQIFPNAQTHAYADAGHWLTEDAHERMVPAFLKFLSDTD
jgi:cis-3-alkyl-4-acyloxetan-2-one decarboxylase